MEAFNANCAPRSCPFDGAEIMRHHERTNFGRCAWSRVIARRFDVAFGAAASMTAVSRIAVIPWSRVRADYL
jgi:hypothetical protein